ncbi:MAG TPA: MarR family transcriptional regulator [Gaiellaceae bacterium]|jgi:DNA-binding MarR family transcriptional regulator|nr:MarR family transcriptional regulator [Gaiellaceae bacterium]
MAEDHIDRFLKKLDNVEAEIDLEVEGIVDRIGGINRRIHNSLKDTLVEYDLTPEDWHVLSHLRLRKEGRPSTPGALARSLDLSSGAMTSRLDRLEKLGHIRRLADPDDRRGVRVELTDEGVAAWDAAATVQARKEAFFASALSPAEQKRLNALLRKIMLAFEANEPPGSQKA